MGALRAPPVFKQGDVGTSWYVIYRGSVNVLVNSVIVCTLLEGEGFGELALVNDKPRSATIVAREDDCQLIAVHKDDYTRIMKDIDRNTVRLEEHGQLVMVLEKKTTAKNAQAYVLRPGRARKKGGGGTRSMPVRCLRHTRYALTRRRAGFVTRRPATGSFVIMSATPKKLMAHLEEDHAAGQARTQTHTRASVVDVYADPPPPAHVCVRACART